MADGFMASLTRKHVIRELKRVLSHRFGFDVEVVRPLGSRTISLEVRKRLPINRTGPDIDDDDAGDDAELHVSVHARSPWIEPVWTAKRGTLKATFHEILGKIVPISVYADVLIAACVSTFGEHDYAIEFNNREFFLSFSIDAATIGEDDGQDTIQIPGPLLKYISSETVEMAEVTPTELDYALDE